jgi:hypothetical protein
MFVISPRRGLRRIKRRPANWDALECWHDHHFLPDAPHESLSLNLAEVNVECSVLDAKTIGEPEIVDWDLTQQKKM